MDIITSSQFLYTSNITDKQFLTEITPDSLSEEECDVIIIVWLSVILNNGAISITMSGGRVNYIIT